MKRLIYLLLIACSVGAFGQASGRGNLNAQDIATPRACVAASASGTAYTCSTATTFTPATNNQILFKADVANTGSATVAVNGASAATVKKPAAGGLANLVANDFIAGQWIVLIFDGTNWQMESLLGNGGTVTSVTGGSTRITVATGTTTPVIDLDPAAGSGVDSGTGTAYVVTGGVITSLTPTGTIECFLPTNANSSTTPTVAFNGLTAKTIVKLNGAPVAVNDMLTTQVSCLVYNGTNFYLLNPQGLTGSGKQVLQGNPSFTTGFTTGGLIVDQQLGTTTAAMSGQTTATCTNVTGMTWNLAANKNYRMSCMIPRTLAASATIQYCLGGPGTATSFSLVAQGADGTAGAWAEIDTLAQTAYGTKTSASAAAANTATDLVYAQIQNGATASGTALTLQTAANGTNAITVLANASCVLTQEN